MNTETQAYYTAFEDAAGVQHEYVEVNVSTCHGSDAVDFAPGDTSLFGYLTVDGAVAFRDQLNEALAKAGR